MAASLIGAARFPRPDHCESCGTPEGSEAPGMIDEDRIVRWSRKHQGWLCRNCYEKLQGKVVDLPYVGRIISNKKA